MTCKVEVFRAQILDKWPDVLHNDFTDAEILKHSCVFPLAELSLGKKPEIPIRSCVLFHSVDSLSFKHHKDRKKPAPFG